MICTCLGNFVCFSDKIRIDTIVYELRNLLLPPTLKRRDKERLEKKKEKNKIFLS